MFVTKCSLKVCTEASWEIESKFAERYQKPVTRRPKITIFGATAQKAGSRFGSEGNHMLLPGHKSIKEGYLAPRLHHALALQETGGGGILSAGDGVGRGCDLKREEGFEDEAKKVTVKESTRSWWGRGRWKMGLSFICRSLLTVYPSVDVPLPRPRFSFHPAWSFILNPIMRRCNNVEGLTITIVSLRAVMNPSLHHPSLPPSIHSFIHLESQWWNQLWPAGFSSGFFVRPSRFSLTLNHIQMKTRCVWAAGGLCADAGILIVCCSVNFKGGKAAKHGVSRLGSLICSAGSFSGESAPSLSLAGCCYCLAAFGLCRLWDVWINIWTTSLSSKHNHRWLVCILFEPKKCVCHLH